MTEKLDTPRKTGDLKVNGLITKRRSSRTFSDKPITQEELDVLFEAARWSASSRNEQPWRFIYAKKGNRSFQAILETLWEGNFTWAKESSVLIVAVAKNNFDFNNSTNRHSFFDVGQAVATMLLQATEMDIYGRQMGGFSAHQAKEALNIPDGYEPVVVIGLGYLGNADNLPENLKQRELAQRTRKPIEELVFKDNWRQQ